MNGLNWIIIIIISLIAGFFDSKGFFFASQIWEKNKFDPLAIVKSGIAFCVGLCFYWLSIYFMNKVGINAAELQTGIWFTVVIIGVAIASGAFLQWQILDKIVAIVALSSLIFLIIRNG